MSRNLRPCGDRVLVKLKNPEEKSTGGIVLVTAINKDMERHASCEAYILRLGHDSFKMLGSGEPWCKVGDLVLIRKYSGENREDLIDGELCRLISDEDILGVFEGEGLK